MTPREILETISVIGPDYDNNVRIVVNCGMVLVRADTIAASRFLDFEKMRREALESYPQENAK